MANTNEHQDTEDTLAREKLIEEANRASREAFHKTIVDGLETQMKVSTTID